MKGVRTKSRRRGGIYVLVLSVSSVTMSIGLIGFSAMVAQREVQALSDDSLRAAQLAESAVQLAVHGLEAGDAWRSTAGGVVIEPMPLGGGTITASIKDAADDDLQDDETEAMTVVGTATVGTAKRTLSVEFEPSTQPIGALDVAIAVSGGMTGSANGHVTAYVWGVPFRAGDGEFLSIGFLYSSANMSWIELPDPSVVGMYAAMGTPVPIAASSDGKGQSFDNLVLTTARASSDDLADFPPAPNGVHVIDADGSDVQILGGSIEGTLVVMNAAGRRVTIIGMDSISPGSNLYPVILTDGDLDMQSMAATTVDRPWPSSDDDGFADPAFDGIRGMIYTSGDISFKDNVDIYGIVMAAGEGAIEDKLCVAHDPAYQQKPPPGFSTIDGLRVRPGSWRTGN